MDLAVLNYLICNIREVLKTEALLLWGVRDAIDDIKNELISMRSFLVDADKKGADSEGEKTWVANVKDMAYEVEDVIDHFIYHINSQRIGGRSARFLHHTIYFPQNIWVRHQTATKLQKINKTIKAIPEMKQRYGVDRIEGTKDNRKWVVRRGESSLFFKEDELVGIENKRQLLMGWLMDGEPQQTVISIVGMGGSGKTTLVANTYNNDVVKRHFECYAWITVSQVYDIEELLRSMIKEFYESRKEENLADLNSLKLQIVSLQDSCLGSRIILTTRKEDVACYHLGGKSYVHHIQLLQKEEAWELFCKKAFSSSPNGSCPSELKLFAQELVGKCEGLPLAIAALGSLMYSKNMSQWKEIYNSLNWSLSNNPMLQAVKTILLLSFNDLPYQLKHCFLYCSLFPEVHEIRRKRLIKLWMAEGFVEQVKGSTPEEVAERYLTELIFRSMLQVEERNGSGRPRRCRMHDLMRELALSISEREKFGVVHDGGEEMKECKARRISIHKNDREHKPFTGMSNIRSFHVFNKSLKTLPSGSKMLRVLDLEDALIDELPDELFKLFNLRYLNLRGTLVKELPKSIGKLLNLQTLDIRNTKRKPLRMDALSSPPPNLQKLVLAGKLKKVPQWFHLLQSLTYLKLHWSRLEEDLLPHIAALPFLGRLSLTNAYVGKTLCFNTGFPKLTELIIRNSPQLNEIIVENGVMPNMKSLYIISCMELKKVPKGVEHLNLQELILRSVSLELKNRIQGEGSVDFPKVQHIPKIYLS
uniref:NB-ARC domain-containing protein n=1 Tax=Fagus sylvatica TaxID=28930 RepID=A0A2N9IQ28_FAGSY